MTPSEDNKKTNLTRRKFLKYTGTGVAGTAALTLGLKPWKGWAGTSTTTLSQTRAAMGTFVEITATGKEDVSLKSAIEAAYKEIDRVEKAMSVFDPKSQVHQLNEPATRKASLGPLTTEVLQEAKRISELTDGSFDVTVAPLLELWGFYDDTLYLPSREELEEILKLVDYRGLSLNSGSVTLPDPDSRIDLGGIAKGYGVDRAVDALKEAGLPAGLINAGGDIRGYGSPEGNRNWKVGLQDPLREDNLLTGIGLLLPAITTSGDYESFFTYRGSKLAHIIDPKTGYPEEDVLSVSVLADSATRADGLSTGAFSQDVEEALEMVKDLEKTELIYIHRDESDRIRVETTEGVDGEVNRSKLGGALN